MNSGLFCSQLVNLQALPLPDWKSCSWPHSCRLSQTPTSLPTAEAGGVRWAICTGLHPPFGFKTLLHLKRFLKLKKKKKKMQRLSGKESACQGRRCGFKPWVGKIPWKRKWQFTPVFLPGKSHGQTSLVDYGLWSHKSVGHDLATKQQTKS